MEDLVEFDNYSNNTEEKQEFTFLPPTPKLRSACELPPLRSKHGYSLILTNLHPETIEDHIYEALVGLRKITDLHVSVDKRTGQNLGYALLCVDNVRCSEEILNRCDYNELIILGNIIKGDYCFVGTENDSKEDEYNYKHSARPIKKRPVRNVDKPKNRDRSPIR